MRTRQARHLRKAATPAERKLWSRLRNRQLIGLKFRRQQPVGNRLADFLCDEAKLAIELDGSGHQSHFTQTADIDKELQFYEQGIRILRFQNTAVMRNIDGVLIEIIRVVEGEA